MSDKRIHVDLRVQNNFQIPIVANDGTYWLRTHPNGDDGWTGWMPGEDGVWLMSADEMRRVYPEVVERDWTKP